MNRTIHSTLCLALCITVTLSGCAGAGSGKPAAGAAVPPFAVGDRVEINTFDGREFELEVKGIEGNCVRTGGDPCAVRIEEIAASRKLAKHDPGEWSDFIGIAIGVVGIAVLTVMMMGLDAEFASASGK
jgi:hypothetical protein